MLYVCGDVSVVLYVCGDGSVVMNDKMTVLCCMFVVISDGVVLYVCGDVSVVLYVCDG